MARSLSFLLPLKPMAWVWLVLIVLGLMGRFFQRPVERNGSQASPGPLASIYLGRALVRPSRPVAGLSPGAESFSKEKPPVAGLRPTVRPQPPPASPVPLSRNLVSRKLAGSRIEVLNGTGAPRVARSLSIILERFGVRSLRVENADRWNYTQTIIRYRPGQDDRAEVLARALGFGHDRVFPSSSLPKNVQMSIILGSDHGSIIRHVTNIP